MESMKELLRPFDGPSHKYRVMNVTKAGDKASVAFYIDARDVMDRLDAVVGQENWQDKYTVLAFSDSRWAVECTLVVNGVAKTDVGEGDAPKDAYSDALKRAAVKFGVGRYLYDMDTGTWFAVDQWKQFTPEAKKQIENLLQQNLARLGVKPAVSVPQRKEVAPQSTPPAAAASNGTATGNASNGGAGNGNGRKTPRWESAGDAYHWAVESGACANEFEAKASMKKIVDAQFDKRLTKDNMAAAFDAFYARQMEKLHELPEAAVQDAPEFDPDALAVPA